MSTDAENDWFSTRPSRLRQIATSATTRFAAGLQNACGNCSHSGFGILLYHRVVEHIAGVSAPTLNVTPAQFRVQLQGLLKRGFVAHSLSELVRAREASREIPANAFAVTFDDGYENNFRYAYPILKELKIPATIFLATKYLGTESPFPFDDWSASGSVRVPAAAWRPMSMSQCRELQANGLIEFGAHTHSHGRYLGRIEYFRRDLRQCLDVMREQLGIEHPTFAFPYGVLDDELVRVARELGVSCALSTHRRRIFAGDAPFAWGRFDAEAEDSAAALAAKLSGWYNTVGGVGKTVTSPLSRFRATRNRPAPIRPRSEASHEGLGTRKVASQP